MWIYIYIYIYICINLERETSIPAEGKAEEDIAASIGPSKNQVNHRVIANYSPKPLNRRWLYICAYVYIQIYTSAYTASNWMNSIRENSKIAKMWPPAIHTHMCMYWRYPRTKPYITESPPSKSPKHRRERICIQKEESESESESERERCDSCLGKLYN